MINLEHIVKKYDKKTILENITVTFERGQSVAFVGHNGCGKSTLLKIIAGLAAPTTGSVNYEHPLVFHYVPEKFMPVALTAEDYLEHMGRLDGLHKEERKRRIHSLCSDFFLLDLIHTPMKYLSKGTLQKIGVIQALLKTPDVLLLDEPLSGQDIESQKVFIQKIQELKEKKVTIFMSCHEPGLIHSVAEDVYTIDKARLIPVKDSYSPTCSLLLENNGGCQLLEGMNQCGDYYRIEYTREQCDQMLPKLLQDGWKLRGLRDEESN